ncbi:MAG: PDZ domain-containing protein [Gloeomargaritaceae cyanobacterium C42_A2020_066]|nr:PDZ domain-containing protein [Gloeomargaritaceae cyanobacterium C42_A2020_066]
MVKSLLTILLAFWVVWVGWSVPAQALTREQQWVTQAAHIIEQSYVDPNLNGQNWRQLRQQALQQPMPDAAATYQVIQDLLAHLGDPFTRVLPPDQFQSLQTNTAGELVGVGLQITLDPDAGLPQVVTPIAGSPAEQAGLQPLDWIVAIDGESTQGMTIEAAADRMRGPAGTAVQLTIERQQEGQAQRLETQLQRQRIQISPVVWRLDTTKESDRLGYIRLTQFSAHAPADVQQAIQTLEAQDVSGFILDLRNNPGGLFQAGIEIAQQWLPAGPVVFTVNRDGFEEGVWATGQPLTEKPLVVLVNRGTASASEILAGALQDNHRAQLVGETTFGKGLIQSVFPLGGRAGLAVSVARYETPAHHNIHRLGITPDVVVALPATGLPYTQWATAQDPQYQAAVTLLSSGGQPHLS